MSLHPRALPWSEWSFPEFYPREIVAFHWREYSDNMAYLREWYEGFSLVQLAEQYRDMTAVQALNREFSWRVLSPEGGVPSGRLFDTISTQYGSFTRFMERFIEEAEGAEWIWLVYNGETIEIVATDRLYTPLFEGVLPLLAVDLTAGDRLDSLWGSVNWTYLEELFSEEVGRIRVSLPGWT